MMQPDHMHHQTDWPLGKAAAAAAERLYQCVSWLLPFVVTAAAEAMNPTLSSGMGVLLAAKLAGFTDTVRFI